MLTASPHANASLQQSQIFASWPAFDSGSNITLTADTTVYHSGAQSLKFVNATAYNNGDNGGFSQAVPVQPSTVYNFSLWLKGSNVTSSFLNNCFVLDQNVFTSQCLPSGTFDWQQMTWSYTTGPTETQMYLAFYSTNTGTIWVDDVSVVQNGAAVNLAANPGFEISQDSITVLYPNPSVIYAPSPSVQVASSAPIVNWNALDSNGVSIGSGGPVNTSGGPADFTLPSTIPPGYFTLRLTTSTNAVYNVPFTLVTNGYVNNSATPNPFGSNIHYYTAASTIPTALGAAGLSNVRIDVIWSQIETSPGVYTWPAALDQLLGFLKGGGIRPLLVLGSANPLYDGGLTPSSSQGIAAYAAWAGAAAKHYGAGGSVDMAVYNEFNIGGAGANTSACGTTPACYYALLQPTANAIHNAVLGVRVVGPTLGGFTPDWLGSNPDSYTWLQQFLALGGLAYLDVVDIHNYSLPIAPPEGANNAVIAEVKSQIASYGGSQPLWLTETGWPTYTGYYTVQQEAQYVVRDAALSLQAGLSQYMTYDFQDDCYPDTEYGQCSFGFMLNPNATASTLAPKPAYTAYAVLARSLAGYTYSGSDNWGAGVYSLRFTDGKGDLQRVAWAPAANTTLAIQSSSAVTVTNWDGSITSVSPVGGTVTLSVGPDAAYLVSSGITGASVVTTAPFTATPPATIHHNEPVSISVAVNGSATGAPTGSVTFSSAYGSTNVTASSGVMTTGTLVLSGFPTNGAVTVPINVQQGSTIVGRLVLSMTVTN